MSLTGSEGTIYSHFNHIKEVFQAIVQSDQEIKIDCKFDNDKDESNQITDLERKITIRRNGNPISFPNEYHNGIYNTRVTSSNNGDKYECEVNNRFYSRTSDTVEVNVQCKFKKKSMNKLKGSFSIVGYCIWVVILIHDIVKTDSTFLY